MMTSVVPSASPVHAGCARSFGRVVRRIASAVSVVAITAAPAHAVSMADIEQLARAGLSDEVLIALIQTDNTVFPLDAERILELRAVGVSEAVIVAMLRNGRSTPGPAAPGEPDGEPNIGSAGTLYDDPQALQVFPPSAPVVVEVHTPQPAYAAPVKYVPYPVAVTRRGHRRHPGSVTSHGSVTPHGATTPFRGFGRFINDGWVERGGTYRTSP